MTKYEPGLGCPYCGWTGSKTQDRTEHIRSEHSGEFAGDSDDILFVKGRAGITADDPFTERRMGQGEASQGDVYNDRRTPGGSRPRRTRPSR